MRKIILSATAALGMTLGLSACGEDMEIKDLLAKGCDSARVVDAVEGDDHTVLVVGRGTCVVDDAEVVIATFDDNDARDQWAAPAVDGGGYVFKGDGWAVASFSSEAVETFASRVE